MYIFRSIHEIINTIFVAKGLLVEVFEKRKVHSFRYSDALTLLKEDENRLKNTHRKGKSYTKTETLWNWMPDSLISSNCCWKQTRKSTLLP